MKAIMISDKAKWCALMMNGIKKDEVRKNKALANAIQKLIDENGYTDIYVYCSKSNYLGYISNKYVGKVVFKFRCYKVEEYTLEMIEGGLFFSKSGLIDFPNEEAQLDNFELLHYAGTKLGTQIYAIHISDLEIFDEPKELSEFYRVCKKCPFKNSQICFDHCGEDICKITKAPQNFCYVEVSL